MLRLSFGKGSKMARKWNRNGSGMGRRWVESGAETGWERTVRGKIEGRPKRGQEKKKCRKVTFLCVKICKWGNVFVTLCDNSARALKSIGARVASRGRVKRVTRGTAARTTRLTKASNQLTQN